MSERTGRITIVVDLPQPMDKITGLMKTLGTLWPDTVVNASPRLETVEVAGGSLVQIEHE